MHQTQHFLKKMTVTLDDNGQAVYQSGQITFNEHLGQFVTLTHTGKIACVACGRGIKKTFNQGYCFPCVRSLPECDTCIIKPELCHYAQGTCRDPSWGQAHCLKPHVVYLANTGQIKVGITRQRNIPTRWLDQGATQAIPIFQVDQRLVAGLVEQALMAHIGDKTNWRTMLKGGGGDVNLSDYHDKLVTAVADDIAALQSRFGQAAIMPITQPEQYQLNYPVIDYPVKIKTHNLDKTSQIQGRLMGVKGQYLMLDTGVINIRKFAGYECHWKIENL